MSHSTHVFVHVPQMEQRICSVGNRCKGHPKSPGWEPRLPHSFLPLTHLGSVTSEPLVLSLPPYMGSAEQMFFGSSLHAGHQNSEQGITHHWVDERFPKVSWSLSLFLLQEPSSLYLKSESRSLEQWQPPSPPFPHPSLWSIYALSLIDVKEKSWLTSPPLHTGHIETWW